MAGKGTKLSLVDQEEAVHELRVRAIDSSAAGSYRDRVALARIVKAAKVAERTQDAEAISDAAIALFEFIERRAYCPDGSDPAELLNEISADDFDAITQRLLKGP